MATNRSGRDLGWTIGSRAAAGFGVGGVPGALIGGAIGLGESIWSAKRADSAHQREVRDLQRAGLNPMLSAGGAGAPNSPVSVSEGVGTGLQVQRQRAELRLLEAQARREVSSARLADTQSWELASFAGTRANEVASRASLANLDAETRRRQMDYVVNAIKSEIEQRMSSAAGSRAVAALNKADLTRVENIAEFEKMLGAGSPAMRMAFEFLRALAAVRR